MPDISKLLSAKSVAVVGASPDNKRLRGILFEVLCRGDYAGRIYPVTPSHDEVRLSSGGRSRLRRHGQVCENPPQEVSVPMVRRGIFTTSPGHPLR